MHEIFITTPFIKLDQLLKYASVASTGGEAKMMIEDGLISLNGEPENRRGKKIYPGDTIVINLDEQIVLNIKSEEI